MTETTPQNTSDQTPDTDDEMPAAPATPEDAAEYAEIYGADAAEDTPPEDDAPDAPEEPARPSGERIAKVMARAGVASRREAERMIVEGRVTVNGTKITSPALDILPSDKVRIDGKPMDAPQETRLWMYYKPVGLVTSEADEKGRQTVFDALPRDLPRVMSVGRLDLNSEGLLLLTNDGELKRRLELPSTGWLRRYRVRVNGQPTDLTFGPLRRGAVIDGEEFAPMEVKIDSQKGANAWLTVGIREGRNREIRRAMAHVGLVVNRLIRISYGPFRLIGLEENEVREVKRRILRDQLGGLLTGEDDTPAERPARAPRREDGGKPRRDGEGFDRKPRASRRDGDGDAPRPRGAYGDRTPRPPRAEDDRPRARGAFADRKPRHPRDEGYQPRPRDEGFDRKPRTPRGEGEGTPSRPRGAYADRKPRFPREDGGKPRGTGASFDRKPRAPRKDGEGHDSRPPRVAGEGAADRKPRWNRDDRTQRPARGEGDAATQRRAPREDRYGARPRDEGSSARPRSDWGDRKPSGSRREGEGFAGRGKPAPRSGPGSKPGNGPRRFGDGPSGPRQGTKPRGFGPKPGPGGSGRPRPSGPRGPRGDK